jgi:hypothetical protein
VAFADTKGTVRQNSATPANVLNRTFINSTTYFSEVIRGNWIGESSGEEKLDKERAFDRLSMVATAILYGTLTSDSTEYANISAALWDSFDSKEQEFRLAFMKFSTKTKRTPPIFKATVVRFLKNTTSENEAAHGFAKLLMAIEYTLDKEYEKAETILSKMLLVEDKDYDYNGDEANRRLKEDVKEFIANKGKIYSYSNFNYAVAKYQSQDNLDKRVKLVCTVSEIVPRTNYNLIGSIIGNYDYHFKDVKLSKDAERVLIEVPRRLSNVVTKLTEGKVIVIKGKMSGLETWNDYIGNVPLIKAEKIEY